MKNLLSRQQLLESEDTVNEGMMSEIDIIAHECDTAAKFKTELKKFLEEHAHDKKASTTEDALDSFVDMYFDKNGKKKADHDDEGKDFGEGRDEHWS